MKEFGMVVTGMGFVSPVGTQKADFFSWLRTGELSTEKAAECASIEPGSLVKHLGISDPKLKIARYMDPVSQNAIVALSGAMLDAGITDEDIAADPYRYGIVLGAARGACLTRDALYGSLESRRGKMVSGTLFSNCGHNIAGAMAAIAHGIKGLNITLAGRDDLGPSIMGRVTQFLVSNRVHTVFAGFTECGGTTSILSETACFLCIEEKGRAVGRGAAHMPQILLHRHASGLKASEGRAVFGFPDRDPAMTQGREIMKLPLPGMTAPVGHYSSVLMLGLLSCGEELGDRYASTAFAAGAGYNITVFRIVYDHAD